MGAKKNEGGKLILAVILLVVAGVVIAWSQGWILGGSKPESGLTAEQTAQQQKNLEEAKKATEQKIKAKQADTAGSS